MRKTALAFVLLVATATFVPTATAAAADPYQVAIDLSGTWKFTTGDNPAYADSTSNTDGWANAEVPLEWDYMGQGSYDGYAWYRRQFFVPASYAGVDLRAIMGRIDDVDATYINGVQIGQTGTFPPSPKSGWTLFRDYPIPADVIRYGENNTIAVRVYDNGGGGGIYDGPVGIFSYERFRQEMLGFETHAPSSKQMKQALKFLDEQRAALATGQTASYLSSIAANYFHDGYDRHRLSAQLQRWRSAYTSIKVIDQNVEIVASANGLIVDTTRSIVGVKADGTQVMLSPPEWQFRYLAEGSGGKLTETGNHSRFFVDSIWSQKLGEQRFYRVYLPPSYASNPAARFPTVYLLHGINGSKRTWEALNMKRRIDALINAHLMSEMIVVMPDADNSWYVNSPDGRRPYQDMIVGEILPAVDRDYRTRAANRYRGLTGISMGGLGSFNIGWNHPHLFTSIAAHMGALNFPPCTSTVPLQMQYCTSQIPTVMAKTLSAEQLRHFRYYFDAGTEDEYAFWAAAAEMGATLTARIVPHQWELRPGHHSEPFWLPYFYKSMAMHTANFAQ